MQAKHSDCDRTGTGTGSGSGTGTGTTRHGRVVENRCNERRAGGPGGALSRAMPGFEERLRAKKDGPQRSAAALEDRQPLIVEAGTGTGKTLAYLVPALASGQRVIVSTGDAHTPGADRAPRRAAVAQGARNRVLGGVAQRDLELRLSTAGCARRTVQTQLRLAPADDDLALSQGPGPAQTVTGDRAELSTVADSSPVWPLITTTPPGPRRPPAVPTSTAASSRAHAAQQPKPIS